VAWVWPTSRASSMRLPVAGEFRRVRAGMNAEQVLAQGARLGRCEALSLVYAVPAALCRPLTAPAAVMVLLPGVALLALAVWRHGPPRQAVCPWRSVVPWVVLALLFGGWELTAALWGNDSAHPTFSLLVDPVLESYPGRLVGWLAWLAVGRWLVAR
jgi:hypothetical protein